MAGIPSELRNGYLIKVGLPVVVALGAIWGFVFTQVDAGTEGLYVLLAGGASAVALLLVLVGQPLQDTTTASLGGLTEKVRKVEQGHPNVDFETDGSGEVAELSEAIDEMSSSLQSQVVEYRTERDELESELEERTSDYRKQKRLNDYLLDRITDYTGTIEDASPEDLSPRMDPDDTVPQLDRHTRAFNSLLEDVEGRTEAPTGSATAESSPSESATAEEGTDQFTITPPEPSEEESQPGKTVAEVKGIVAGAYPDDELPWHLYNRLFLKTGINLDDRPDRERLSEDEVDELMDAARDIVGEFTTA
ncbi:hypothetical protein BRD00_03235 [Halobacteriales archaeon QS_8_69_26]|nr:MAG: hypothetical protein BRD00_03235 [Halobacteriales archaeon QS_8_69_26]